MTNYVRTIKPQIHNKHLSIQQDLLHRIIKYCRCIEPYSLNSMAVKSFKQNLQNNHTYVCSKLSNESFFSLPISIHEILNINECIILNFIGYYFYVVGSKPYAQPEFKVQGIGPRCTHLLTSSGC